MSTVPETYEQRMARLRGESIPTDDGSQTSGTPDSGAVDFNIPDAPPIVQNTATPTDIVGQYQQTLLHAQATAKAAEQAVLDKDRELQEALANVTEAERLQAEAEAKATQYETDALGAQQHKDAAEEARKNLTKAQNDLGVVERAKTALERERDNAKKKADDLETMVNDLNGRIKDLEEELNGTGIPDDPKRRGLREEVIDLRRYADDAKGYLEELNGYTYDDNGKKVRVEGLRQQLKDKTDAYNNQRTWFLIALVLGGAAAAIAILLAIFMLTSGPAEPTDNSSGNNPFGISSGTNSADNSSSDNTEPELPVAIVPANLLRIDTANGGYAIIRPDTERSAYTAQVSGLTVPADTDPALAAHVTDGHEFGAYILGANFTNVAAENRAQTAQDWFRRQFDPDVSLGQNNSGQDRILGVVPSDRWIEHLDGSAWNNRSVTIILVPPNADGSFPFASGLNLSHGDHVIAIHGDTKEAHVVRVIEVR